MKKKKMRELSQNEMDKVSGGVTIDEADHIAVIDSPKLLCPWCRQRFQTLEALQEHIMGEHEKKKPRQRFIDEVWPGMKPG